MSPTTNHTPARRYVVIGAGGVGAALAAGLSDADIDVVLVSRGTTLETIRRDGLRFSQAGRTRVLDVAVASGPDDLELRIGDVLVLATKSQDAALSLPSWAWAPVVGPEGRAGLGADLPIVLLQNGLDTERVAARYFHTVVGAVAMIAARHVVSGQVDVANTPRIGQLIVGAYPSALADPEAAEVAETVAAELDRANWLSQAVPQIQRWLAWKVLANVTFAVGVLSGTADEQDALRRDLTVEARAILALAGHEFADPETERAYDVTQARIDASGGYGTGQQSTWQSFERGSSSEVDFLNGEVALLARLHGGSAPLNTALQRVLGRSAALAEKPGTHTVAEVREAAGQRPQPPAPAPVATGRSWLLHCDHDPGNSRASMPAMASAAIWWAAVIPEPQ